jgi:uncharacterized protein (DUF1697 family)
MYMTKYVALLRGIGPGNPNMRNDKLRGVFESLGFTNVRTVISSGNVLFESSDSSIPALEAMIEKAFPEQLGFTSTTIIRSAKQWQELLDKNPFTKYQHGPTTYLTVTFLKTKPGSEAKNQALPEGKDYQMVAVYDREICFTVDTTAAKTPDLMLYLEKRFGKQITTRTWKTVERIHKQLGYTTKL